MYTKFAEFYSGLRVLQQLQKALNEQKENLIRNLLGIDKDTWSQYPHALRELAKEDKLAAIAVHRANTGDSLKEAHSYITSLLSKTI